MSTHQWFRRPAARDPVPGGFTLVELLVSLTVLTVIVGAAFLVLHTSSHSKETGTNLTEAQQNARFALNAILGDLRSAGYGLDRERAVPIEVASQYRMTLVIDRDRDGVVEAGERITYFVDPDQGQRLSANTANPYDYVLRRVVSTDADSAAAPAEEAGEVVGYLVTQRTANNRSTRDAPLFRYFDETGAEMTGAADDPAGANYGTTLPDSVLGLPVGTGIDPEVSRVQVRVITETATPRRGTTNDYRRFDLSARVQPRNFAFDLASAFSVVDSSGAPFDSSGAPGDTVDAPPDTTITPPMPDSEPPIRISTARVLSMFLRNLNEIDSAEGSRTTVNGQFDLDLVLGTKASSVNNLSAWFNGQPEKYDGLRLYQPNPNYSGNSPYDLTDIWVHNLDLSPSAFNDVAAAVRISDVTGGFQVWFNQHVTYPGYVGAGWPTTAPSMFYAASGQGLAINGGDFDNDGDRDIILGTRTGTNTGDVEVWRNTGGTFDRVAKVSANGEVHALVPVDYNGDGLLDVVAGTKNNTNDKSGQIVVFRNTGTSLIQVSRTNAAGKIGALAVGDLNQDGRLDVVAGSKTGTNTGKVEFWKGTGAGFLKADEVVADGPVLSIAVGPIDYGNSYPDVVAGNQLKSVQAWFVDPFQGDANVLPADESWADANAGGEVHAVAIGKIEVAPSRAWSDPLFDIVIGTAVSATTGEIVIYLNPYTWTVTP